MVVQQNSKGIAIDGLALIAWNGSPAANAGLRAAAAALRARRHAVRGHEGTAAIPVGSRRAIFLAARHSIPYSSEAGGDIGGRDDRQQIRVIELGYLVMCALVTTGCNRDWSAM